MRSRDAGTTWENASPIAHPKGARHIEQLIPDPKAIEEAGKPITYVRKAPAAGRSGRDRGLVTSRGTRAAYWQVIVIALATGGIDSR